MAGCVQSTVGFSDDFYAWSGFLAACVFPIALVPQVLKTFRTRSAEDLSYFWQGCFLAGLLGLIVYSAKYRLWPILYPMIPETGLMIILLLLKVQYDLRDRKLLLQGSPNGLVEHLLPQEDGHGNSLEEAVGDGQLPHSKE